MQIVNSESDGSGDALAERYIPFKITAYCHFCLIVQASLVYTGSLRGPGPGSRYPKFFFFFFFFFDN